MWDWKRKYEYGKDEPQPPTCGVDWILQLRSPDGKAKYATGYEKYPETFNNLVEIFDELLGNKYDLDNKFVNYDEEEEELEEESAAYDEIPEDVSEEDE